MNDLIAEKTKVVLSQLESNARLLSFVDIKLTVPDIYRGTDSIKLTILGQDPTVKNTKSREAIKVVLNLDKKHGNLYLYLDRICKGLALNLEQNIYASNFFKNFFTAPPTTIKEMDIFKEFTPVWLPLLKEELAQFPGITVITLGEPLLGVIAKDKTNSHVRDFWGYTPEWQTGAKGPYGYLEPEENILDRVVFPFPHQPSIGKKFYDERLNDYISFVKQHLS